MDRGSLDRIRGYKSVGGYVKRMRDEKILGQEKSENEKKGKVMIFF